MTIKPQYLMERQGKIVALYAGLLDEAHAQGLHGIETQLIQTPTNDNGHTAICFATVTLAGEGGAFRRFTGIGDASPTNVTKMVVNALIRMAETRAKARALRDAINLGEALADDPASDEDDAPAVLPSTQDRKAQLAAVRTALAATARPAGDPAPAPAAQPPAGNKMTRSQLWAAYRALVGQCFALHSAGTATLPEHLAKLCHFPPDVPDDDLKAGYKHLLAWNKAAKEGQG